MVEQKVKDKTRPVTVRTLSPDESKDYISRHNGFNLYLRYSFEFIDHQQRIETYKGKDKINRKTY